MMSLKKQSIFVLHASDYLTNHKPHGDGLTAFAFISRLAERGHTLQVAAPEMDLKGELPANLHLHLIKTTFQNTILHRLEYMLRSRLLLNRLRRKEQIDVIHQLNPVNKGLSLAMLGSGLPLVLGIFVGRWPSDAEQLQLSWREQATEAVKDWLKRGLLRLQQWQASALLVTTPAAREILYLTKNHEHKLVPLPIGVDVERFKPSLEESASDEPRILFFANLWRRKGIFTLLDAFDRVIEQVPNCRLTIAGDGVEREAVARRVAASSHRDRIEMIGAVTREQAPALMRHCTVYCLPSYGEPLGITALEAMATAKPIVGTNAGGLGYLIRAEGGRKVAPRDAEALAQALAEILLSPELQRRMGAFNRQWIEEEFAWDTVVSRLEAVYDSVTASWQPNGALQPLGSEKETAL